MKKQDIRAFLKLGRKNSNSTVDLSTQSEKKKGCSSQNLPVSQKLPCTSFKQDSEEKKESDSFPHTVSGKSME
jgi:hypothetical protein